MQIPMDPPSFVEQQTLGSILTLVAVPLVAYDQETNTSLPLGTATVIAPGIALTARHEVEMAWERFHPGVPLWSVQGARFSLVALMVSQDSTQGAALHVRHVAVSGSTDLAVLALKGWTDIPFQWLQPVLSLAPPPVGEMILACGYPRQTARMEPGRFHLATDLFMSTGSVEEVHDRSRDSFLVSWPCFRTNARIDSGMSGGPVVDSKSRICGIVCSSMDGEGPQTSYGTSLWPVMGTALDWARTGAPPGPYPFRDLVSSGHVHAIDANHVVVKPAGNGYVTRLLARPKP